MHVMLMLLIILLKHIFLRKDTYFSIPVMPQLCIKYTHKKEYLHVLYIKMVNNKKFCLNLGTYYSEELETDPQLSVNYEKFKILVDYDEVLYLKKALDALDIKELSRLSSIVSKLGYGNRRVTRDLIKKCKEGSVDTIEYKSTETPKSIEKPIKCTDNEVESKQSILSDIEMLELKIKREELKKRLRDLEKSN